MKGRARALERTFTEMGCEMSRTRKNHLRIQHVETGIVVFASGTPSDHRSDKNAITQLRRAIRQAHV